MARREFQNPTELAAWLAATGVDTNGWGEGGTKGPADLWAEYERGESSFQDCPPARVVEVAQVIIRRGDTVLIELEQEFADGRRRTRLRQPSEKLQRGEEPRHAAIRCLREELGLSEQEVVVEQTAKDAEAWLDSPSYPGLPTRYLFHIFEAAAEHLPDEDFYRINIAPHDPIRRHHWGWRRET